MDPIVLNKCIDSEPKYYGLKLLGLVSGAITGVIVCIIFNFTFAIGASVVGYLFGAYVSSLWHTGTLQRAIYWNLPSIWLKLMWGSSESTKYLPSSHNRNFM